VRDKDDAGGWIHHALLRGARTAVVTAAPNAALRASASPDAAVVAIAETGAVARLEACTPRWCRIEAEGIEGWIEKSAIWGVDPEEAFD
jgi:SH3-like domain-containing protein